MGFSFSGHKLLSTWSTFPKLVHNLRLCWWVGVWVTPRDLCAHFYFQIISNQGIIYPGAIKESSNPTSLVGSPCRERRKQASMKTRMQSWQKMMIVERTLKRKKSSWQTWNSQTSLPWPRFSHSSCIPAGRPAHARILRALIPALVLAALNSGN